MHERVPTLRLPPLISSPTERTTAATDVLLAVQAAGYALDLLGKQHHEPWKARLWAAAFANASIGATLGAVAHGFAISPELNDRLWAPLQLSLSMAVALFVAGTLYDTHSPTLGKRSLLPLLGGAAAFWKVVPVTKEAFWPFTVFQGAGMLVGLQGYGRQAVVAQDSAARWMLMGIILSAVAGVVQASPALRVRVIWELDQNGLYHLIQMIGLAAIHQAVQQGLSVSP